MTHTDSAFGHLSHQGKGLDDQLFCHSLFIQTPFYYKNNVFELLIIHAAQLFRLRMNSLDEVPKTIHMGKNNSSGLLSER